MIDERELYGVLENYKNAIDSLVARNSALEQKIADLEASTTGKIDSLSHTLFDEVLNPIRDSIDGFEKEKRFNEFHDKYGAKLDPLNDTLTVVERKPMDLSQIAFEQWDSKSDEDKGAEDEDSFVDALIQQVGNQLDEIKAELGLPANSDMTVEQKPDGTTEVKSDGETVAETEEPAVAEEKPEEKPAEEEPKAPKEDAEEEGEEETDPEELAAYEEELKKYAASHK